MIIKKSNIILIAVTMAFSVAFYGCSGGGQTQPPAQQQSGQSEKNPEQLSKLESEVDSMIGMLSGVPNEPEKKLEQKIQSEQQKKSQQSGGQQQGGQQQENQAGPKALLQPKPEVSWEQALINAEKIHTQWNDYVAKAAKDGVSKSNIDGFSTMLNQLTVEIGSKNRTAAILAANNMSLQLANFWMLYDSKVPPDLKRLKHYVRNTIYYSDLLEWTKVDSSMNYSKDIFQGIRTTANKDKQDMINKVDFSIQELERVVKGKNPPLIKLKAKLVLDNLDALEKDMKQSK